MPARVACSTLAASHQAAPAQDLPWPQERMSWHCSRSHFANCHRRTRPHNLSQEVPMPIGLLPPFGFGSSTTKRNRSCLGHHPSISMMWRSLITTRRPPSHSCWKARGCSPSKELAVEVLNFGAAWRKSRMVMFGPCSQSLSSKACGESSEFQAVRHRSFSACN